MFNNEELLIQIVKDFGVGSRLPNDFFFEEGNNALGVVKKYGLWEEDDEDFYHEPVSVFRCHVMRCRQTFDSMYQYDLHYNTSHRYVCSECKKKLHTPHLLDLHISENHDSYFAAQAERKPMFQCYLEECKSVFENPQMRKDHCLTVHKFPSSFPFGIRKFWKQKATPAKLMEKEAGKKKERNAVLPQTKGDEMEVVYPRKAPKKEPEGSSKKPRKEIVRGPGANSKKVGVNEDPNDLPKSKVLGPAAQGGGRRFFNSFVKDMVQSLPMETEEDRPAPENT